MSNQLVGGVYQAIINEVIDASRADFEEVGVEEGVMEELRIVSLFVSAVIFPPSSLSRVHHNLPEGRAEPSSPPAERMGKKKTKSVAMSPEVMEQRALMLSGDDAGAGAMAGMMRGRSGAPREG